LFTNWTLSGSDADTSEHNLIGGAGDAGFNEFILGDWIKTGNIALMTDFDTSEHIIVVFVADDNAEAKTPQ